MKTKPTITFHLGMSKAGSTFLQRNVFPHFKGITFFKKRHFRKHQTIDSKEVNQSCLFSCELYRDFETELKRIASIHDQFNVIYVLRKHEDWIISRYKYYIRKHGYKTFEEFVSFDKPDLSELYFDHLDLQKSVDLIHRYTQGEILFIDFDDLKKDTKNVVGRIGEALGAKVDHSKIKYRKVNKAFNDKQLIVLRRFNALFRYKPSNSKVKMLRKLHYKYREFLLHTIAFFSTLIPNNRITEEEIIDEKIVSQIRKKYEEDWAYCKKCMEK